jgi:hypothetical protein
MIAVFLVCTTNYFISFNHVPRGFQLFVSCCIIVVQSYLLLPLWRGEMRIRMRMVTMTD